MQDQHWRPILDWAQSTFDIEVSTTDSFLLDPHPVETYEKLDELLSGFDNWEMAGKLVRQFIDFLRADTYAAMERATYTSKSFLIALALVKRRITAEQAAQAAHAEVNSQIEQWGEVEDCEYSDRIRDVCLS